MGPDLRILAHGRSCGARFALSGSLFLSLIFGLASTEVFAATASEDVRVERFQVDVSVIDPRGDHYASVPGIPLDAFRVRINGSFLTPEQWAETDFDEICVSSDDRADSAFAPPAPATLIALIDLNFLNARMRYEAGKALYDLAEQIEGHAVRVKVLAYTDQLLPLTPDFTRDPDEIREAGDRLVKISGRGLPLTGMKGVRPRMRQEKMDPRPLYGRAGGDDPTDPEELVDAISFADPSNPYSTQYDFTLANRRVKLSSLGQLARRAIDPRPSLAAIEAVMLSHQAIRGRKSVVLFTSSWFDLPEEMWGQYLRGAYLASQTGFTLSSVDCRGLGRTSGSHDSRLLSHLAGSTGGSTLHLAGRLGLAFERALSQLSCYYLFTLPVIAPGKENKITRVEISIDRRRYPEFFRYRVRHAEHFTVLSEKQRSERRRMAALMEPNAYGFPEVRLTAAYPDGSRPLVTPVEVSVMLADLAFEAETDENGKQALVAEFSWEGLVSDGKDRTVCRLGDGQRRVVRSESLPSRHPPALLVLNQRCVLPGPGSYSVRVVVEDVRTQSLGASSTVVNILEPSQRSTRLSSVRLGRNSGRDFLYDISTASSLEVQRDKQRQAFIPLAEHEAIVISDQLKVRFVVCGEEKPPRTVLYRKILRKDHPAASTWKYQPLFQILPAPRGRQVSESQHCREYEAIVPENTLQEGTHGIAFFERRGDLSTRDLIEKALHEGDALETIEFKVAPIPDRTIVPPRPGDRAGLFLPGEA